jgi:hypothetical protein
LCCQLIEIHLGFALAAIDKFIGIPGWTKLDPRARISTIDPLLQTVDDMRLRILKVAKTVLVFLRVKTVIFSVPAGVRHRIIRLEHDCFGTGIQTGFKKVLE